MWSFPSLHITGNHLINNPVIKFLQFVAFQSKIYSCEQLSSQENGEIVSWDTSKSVVSAAQGVWFCFHQSVLLCQVVLINGNNKGRRNREASVRKMSTEIEKGKETSHDVMWLYNRGIEPELCFRNLFLPTYGYFEINKILWRPFFCFVGVLLLSSVFVHDILAVCSLGGYLINATPTGLFPAPPGGLKLAISVEFGSLFGSG